MDGRQRGPPLTIFEKYHLLLTVLAVQAVHRVKWGHLVFAATKITE